MDLAELPLIDVGEGWDNKLFRLGDALAVRLPRRAASAALIEHEQRWLPRLSAGLPLPVPVPLRVGRPGCGFPWSWSVVPWFAGESALVAPPPDPALMADALARFLRALHQPAPDDAPQNPWRVFHLRLAQRRCGNTSSNSNGSWTAWACSLCGSTSLRRLHGRGRQCGSMAIFILGIC